jgi:hypothetical protein
MPLGLGLGITKLKSLVSGLRVRFQGNATITAALDGILRELSADFVSNGTVTAALEAIKLLDVDFSGDGTLTADLASFEGVLDLVPANASRAYGLWLLSSTYSGPLVRIRKNTGGQPEKDFYPDSNFELSLSSDDGNGTTLGSWVGSNDAFLVTKYDQSGNGEDATQSSASLQDKIVNSGALITLNSKVAAQDTVAGSYDFTSLSCTGADGYYIVGVYQNDNNQKIVSQSSNNHIWAYSSNAVEYRENGLTFYPSGVTTNNGSQTIFRFARNQTDSVHVKFNSNETSTSNADSGKTLNLDTAFICSGYFQLLIIWDDNVYSYDSDIITKINDYYSVI